MNIKLFVGTDVEKQIILYREVQAYGQKSNL